MKYWKIIKYRIDEEYNNKYPLVAIVVINGEPETHLWRLPQECINSEDYDWSEAVKVNNIFEDS